MNMTNLPIQKWRHMPIEGCVCTNGKPYLLSFKRGKVNKLLVNFLGGGVSWSEETAARPITIGAMLKKAETFYTPDVPPIPLKIACNMGLLKARDQRNPLHEWHVLNIPYASADFYLGDNDYPYQSVKGEGKALHHHGQKNVMAALALLKEFFPQTPDTLLIMGQSAGGFGALAYAPQIQALYPACEHTIVYSEGSHIHTSLWPEVARDVWNVKPELLAYIKSADLVADLFRYARDHMPDSTLFLHSNTVWDKMLVEMMYKMNHGEKVVNAKGLKEFHDTLLHVTRTLKEEIPHYFYYLTDYGRSQKDGTTAHIFAGTPKLLYNEIQDSMSVATWLCRGIEGKPVDIGTKFL